MKRYYKEKEMVWFTAGKTKAKVLSLDIPNLSARISIRQTDGSFIEKTVKFMEIDKLKEKKTTKVEQSKPSQRKDTVLWAKVRDNAIVPTKEDENAGYDLYPNFEDSYITIYPQQVKMIGTGIAMSLKDNYVFVVKERGSTGSKAMSVRAGVVDSSYRGEVFVAINNTSDVPIAIVKKDGKTPVFSADTVIYPYEKAIAQGIILPVPKLNHKIISYEDLLKIPSKRGTGKLGQSGK